MKRTLPALAAFISLIVNAQSPGNLSYLSSTTGAASYEIEYYNNRIYVGAGNTLIAYTVAGNGTPGTIVFQSRRTSTISDIKMRGNYMYVAENHAGISVWNIQSGTPQLADEYQPASLDEAAYDIAFKGPDSLFVAYKSKMAIFRFSSSALTFLGTFAQQNAGTYVMGCDVKNNLLAFATSAFGSTTVANSQTGVHLCDANNPASQFAFWQQDTCDPQDVIFGQNTSLLHVMGGTESWVNGNSMGIYYALNVSNPSAPQLVFEDSLPNNFFFNIAQPMNAALRNDTLFIATEGAWDRLNTLNPDHGYVYVYNCNNNQVQFVNELNAGLWHFDVTLNGSRMYVASEWYGVKTVDISNIMSETDMGNTLTGGWNLSSDKFQDKLILANEGYGFKQFNMQDPYNPVYQRSKIDTGFCQGINFSRDGSHIFGWYYTDDDFRVFDTSATFPVVASIPLVNLADYFDPAVYQDYAIADQRIGANHYLVAMNCSNYSNPVQAANILMGGILYRDMCVSKSGYVFTATTGTVKVYNINNNFQQVTSVNAPLGQTFYCMAEYKDTLYCYMDGTTPGIRKYFFNGSTLNFISGNVPLTIPKPKFLAVDSFGLYADYQEEGLYAFNRNSTYSQGGYYRHSMEFYRPNNWGQQQLFCKDNFIFDVEYQGQTSILSFDPQLVSVKENTEKKSAPVFPVPLSRGAELTIPVCSSCDVNQLYPLVYDAKGSLKNIQWKAADGALLIQSGPLSPGIYFFSVLDGKEQVTTGKFIVQ